MVGAACIRQGIDRVGVAVAATFRHGDGLRFLWRKGRFELSAGEQATGTDGTTVVRVAPDIVAPSDDAAVVPQRSEEHTSELQSPVHLVCRLLLEKKKKSNVPVSLSLYKHKSLLSA